MKEVAIEREIADICLDIFAKIHDSLTVHLYSFSFATFFKSKSREFQLFKNIFILFQLIYFAAGKGRNLSKELFYFVFRFLFRNRSVKVWIIRVAPNLGPMLKKYLQIHYLSFLFNFSPTIGL